MQKEDSTRFILSKVAALQSALFFPEMAEGILHTCVISAVKTDNPNYISFEITRPLYSIDTITGFPCRMDFFKKGAGFYIKLNGIATVVKDKGAIEAQRIIIRVRIEKSFYFEIPVTNVPVKTKKPLFIEAFNNWCEQIFNKAFPAEMKVFEFK